MPTETTVVRDLRPADTLALFYSIDDAPGVAVKFCAEATLQAAVHSVMFCGPGTTAAMARQQMEESAGLCSELLKAGTVDLGDGRLWLARGVAGATAFLLGRLGDALSEARFEDSRRYDQMQRAEHYEGRYRRLCDTLADALEHSAARVVRAIDESRAEVPAHQRPSASLRWAFDIFGAGAHDRIERALRFGEEALELLHREGVTLDQLSTLGQRVFSRPPGDLAREIGQAALTLEMLAANAGHSAAAEAACEFERVRSIPKEEWTRRHGAKAALGIANVTPAAGVPS